MIMRHFGHRAIPAISRGWAPFSRKHCWPMLPRMMMWRPFPSFFMRHSPEWFLTRDSFFPSSIRYDINDKKDKFEIALDVPGIDAKDIRVTLEDTVLTLHGERESTSENGSSYYSKFSQSFELDSSVETDKLTASLKNGVLTVSAPKDLSKIEEMVKNIPVEDMSNDAIEQVEEEIKIEPAK